MELSTISRYDAQGVDSGVDGLAGIGVWWQAGKLVREVGDEQSWDVHERREFQNDALLALTARGKGALLVTSNRPDFELLERRVGVRVQYL